MSSVFTRGRRRWALVAAAFSLLAAPALGVTSTFEAGDGNLAVDVPGRTDWASFAGAPSLTIATDRPSSLDDVFTQGTKADTEQGVIAVSPVGPKKTDFLRMYAATERVQGVPFLYLAWVRAQDPGGTTSLDFELNQSTATHPNGLPVRTADDILLIYDFKGVQTGATITLHRWVTSGACAAPGGTAPCWGPGQLLGPNAARAAVNAGGAVADPIGGGIVASGTFGEAAIQLWTSGILPSDRCVHFGRAYVKSRDGGGFVSALGDLIQPVPIDVGNCDVAIAKTAPASVALGQSIAYAVTVANVGDVPVSLADLHVSDPSLTQGGLAFAAVVQGNQDAVLDPGEVWEYRLPGGGMLAAPARACGPVANTASVAPLPAETATGNNTATVSTTVAGPGCAPAPPITPAPVVTGQPAPVPTTRLKLTKRTRAGVRARRPIPFRITVRNTGTAIARDVRVTDRLPYGTSLVRRPRGVTIRRGVVRWAIGDLAPGQRVTVGLWLRSNANRARRLCNSSRAAADNAPPVAARACTRVLRVVGVNGPPRVTG